MAIDIDARGTRTEGGKILAGDIGLTGHVVGESSARLALGVHCLVNQAYVFLTQCDDVAAVVQLADASVNRINGPPPKLDKIISRSPQQVPIDRSQAVRY